MRPVGEDDIVKIIKKLKNKKSVGYDGITTEAIPKIMPYITKKLVEIIINIYVERHWLNLLKTAVVIPIH